MHLIKRYTAAGLLSMALLPLFACSGQRPTHLGVFDHQLAACPSSPNCVSSDASDSAHHVAALKFNGDANQAWQRARQAVLELPRTHIVTDMPDYLHAECQSAVFGFVDDLELHLRPADGIIAIRSASRLGHSDLGVNRKRVETLRQALIKSGLSR